VANTTGCASVRVIPTFSTECLPAFTSTTSPLFCGFSIVVRLDPAVLAYYGNTMPVISFKVSAADARMIRARARARRQTLSEYLRAQALPRRRTANTPHLKTHRASGLAYDDAPGDQVTAEEIRAALADFP
jgi:hypothetical protein